MYYSPLHNFHIPVMGLAYTIDSPLKVARFGIASVMSIVEDKLIEMMRRQYYPGTNRSYQPIPATEPDYRAKRITDYLDLVNAIVQSQIEKIKKAAFEKGSEIVKYFEMLPDDSTLKQLYRQMLNMENPAEKAWLEMQLRNQIRPGSIDVNIMTKVDRETYTRNGAYIPDSSDAVTALRGYANSRLTNSALVLSAGMNPRLYNYLGNCPQFQADENGEFAKRVIVKVSDYRSAFIQGKYLAKKGIWVSEFRIESGLNCGGHAFATEGYLLGPILEEFKSKREELRDTLAGLYTKALEDSGKEVTRIPGKIIFSVQGGIGTAEEEQFLRRQYAMDSTGWGSPFLLVPEATTVDPETLELLSRAKKEDLLLSHSSPLGVRFHYLRGTSGEKERQGRINNGKPGSPCTEKHLAFNTEFTREPICTASRKYQDLKIRQLQSLNLPENEYQQKLAEVTGKECLCAGLSNAASLVYKQAFIPSRQAVTMCPGPNIAHFSTIVPLQTMTDHIYGRTDIITDPARPHMFITELRLYINHLAEQLAADIQSDQNGQKKKSCGNFYHNLREGIRYYRQLPDITTVNRDRFFQALQQAETELDKLNTRYKLTGVYVS